MYKKDASCKNLNGSIFCLKKSYDDQFLQWNFHVILWSLNIYQPITIIYILLYYIWKLFEHIGNHILINKNQDNLLQIRTRDPFSRPIFQVILESIKLTISTNNH